MYIYNIYNIYLYICIYTYMYIYIILRKNENVIKNELVSYLGKYFCHFISAHRRKYGTQQVLIRLLEEWKEILCALLMDLSKVTT